MADKPDRRDDPARPEPDETGSGRRQDEPDRPARPDSGAASEGDEEVIDRTPDPMPDRRVYFPRGWGCALLVLFVALIWLLVGVLWNPEWWPFWHEVRWGVGT